MKGGSCQYTDGPVSLAYGWEWLIESETSEYNWLDDQKKQLKQVYLREYNNRYIR